MIPERRKIARIECLIPTALVDLDDHESSGPSFAAIKNVSQSGLMMTVHELLPLDHVLSLMLYPRHREIVEVAAIPAWVKRNPEGHGYDVGVKVITSPMSQFWTE